MSIRYAGLALMIGIVLTMIASFLYPGALIINPVDQTDFEAAVGAIGDATEISHILAIVSIIATLLMIFGLMALYPLATRDGTIGGSLLRFGIIASVIEWTIIVVATGMRIFVGHLTQRADAATDGAEAQAFLDAALTTHTEMVAILLAFIVLFPMASALTGLGIASRIPSMNIFKISAYALPALAVAAFINILLALLGSAENAITHLLINNLFLSLSAVALFILGLGMYQSVQGLADE